MKFIEPKVEYWPQGKGMKGVWDQIAKATRVSYQSKAREGESSEDFVKRVILKPALIEGNLNDLESCKFDFTKMHGSCLEHGTIFLSMPTDTLIPISLNPWYFYEINAYSKGGKACEVNGKRGIAYTANMRVILENGKLDDLQYMCEPTEYHPRRYTFAVTTDIGVSREANRNRTFSVTEESTRYCCYNANKFGSEIKYARPAWLNEENSFTAKVATDMGIGAQIEEFYGMCRTLSKNGAEFWTADEFYEFALLASEFAYMGMRAKGEPADHCRQVLPLNAKTQVVYTAFAKDWEHFLKLRADNVSGKAHENIQIIAKKTKNIIENF
jgi:thymidylate synthase ThyX